MNRRLWVVLAMGGLCWSIAGCVNVKAPEKIEVGGGRAERVDSTRIPDTASHEEARQELRKAYAYIRDLEHDRERLEAKANKYKHERDEYKDRLKKYEDD